MALTPICFVSIIELYKYGFDTLDGLSQKLQTSFYEQREREVLDLMELQFVLSYAGNISKEDTDNMSLFELKNWFTLLKKQRQIEQNQENDRSKK